MLQQGMIINDTYQIEQQIGAGGGGVVYRARHLRLNTEVVVKQLYDSLRGKVAYRQEADVLKQLKHPYLPRVYDFIETEDAVYTVMDFIPGTGLDKLLEKYGSFTQKLAMRWAVQLGEAVAYLHSQVPVVIHSDIKPANIIITPEGNVCLIDFNIAVVLDESAKSFIGVSAGYSPPEQYRDIYTYQRVTHIQNLKNTQTEKLFSQICGVSRNGAVIVDTRSDIYSLGCVLYHVLTGRAPDTNFEYIASIGQSEIEISEGFQIIIERMMNLYPEKRYQNGSEYLEAIRNCYKLDHRYLSMRRREKIIAMSAACFFIAGAGLTGFGIHQQKIYMDSIYENRLLEADKYVEQQNYDEAIRFAEQLEKSYPKKLKAYERELYYMYAACRYEECLLRIDQIFAEQLIDEKQKNAKDMIADIYYLRANANYELGNYDQSVSDMEQAIAYNESRSVYYRDYSLFLAKSGNTGKAKKVLEEAERHGLESNSLKFMKAEIAYADGDYELASREAAGLISQLSDEEMKRRATELCLDAYRALGKYKQEIELLDQIGNQVNIGQQILFQQYEAQAYLDLSMKDTAKSAQYEKKALDILKEIRESGYSTFRLEENIAILHENQGDFKAAQQLLQKMREDYPEDYRVYKRLAFLEVDKQQHLQNKDRDYRQMKKYYDRAKELYNESVKEDIEMSTLDAQMQDVVDGGWLD